MTDHESAFTKFVVLPVGETCTMPGVEWNEDKVLPCGEVTIGAGVFCFGDHKQCSYESVCERHKKLLNEDPGTWVEE